MKNIGILSLFVFLLNPCFSQTLIDSLFIDSVKVEIEKEANTLKSELEAKEYLSTHEKEIFMGFTLDTFKIERLLAICLETDYSTNGMIQSLYRAEKGYDGLLNLYYTQLISKLSKTDKEVLKSTQKKWLQFRDSERLFSQQLAKDEYSGGGSIQRLLVASDFLELTKKRVIDLNKYLRRVMTE